MPRCTQAADNLIPPFASGPFSVQRRASLPGFHLALHAIRGRWKDALGLLPSPLRPPPTPAPPSPRREQEREGSRAWKPRRGAPGVPARRPMQGRMRVFKASRLARTPGLLHLCPCAGVCVCVCAGAQMHMGLAATHTHTHTQPRHVCTGVRVSRGGQAGKRRISPPRADTKEGRMPGGRER